MQQILTWSLLGWVFCVFCLACECSDASGQERTFTVSFQNGFDGYSGTVDTEIWALAPKTLLHKNPNASSDANNDGGESQVLMRFDGIIGKKPGQIPPHSTVISARLIVSAFDQGTTVNLHRMLVPFEECATWDSMVSGVSADGFEACRQKDGFTFGKIAASSSGAIFDVRDTVQLWVNGLKNHGWVFLNTGGNGWDFYVSEFERKDQHPKLVVEFVPPQADASQFANGRGGEVVTSRGGE
jgi:hypothetical protein